MLLPFRTIRYRPSIGSRRHCAFTLIELVTVIVILGVLSAVAVPMYLDYTRDAKSAACKAALGGMRAAIANYHTFSLTPSGGGTSQFPSILDLSTIGTVLQDAVPPNPYDSDAVPNNVVDATGQTRGTIVGTTKGWAYNPVTGEIWANSGSKTQFENTY